MRIVDIYKQFDIPPNLQEHMIRVYGIICFLQKHWSGESVDWNLIKKMTLLHDMGNITKFNFDTYPEFLGKEIVNIDHWKFVQQEFVKKYGSDDDIATRKILSEIGIDPNIVETIFQKNFGNSIGIMNSQNLHLKLLYYGDLRTLPFRIGSLEERIIDIGERYSTKPNIKNLFSACRAIETQIQSQLNISVSEITDQSARVKYKDLVNFEI